MKCAVCVDTLIRAGKDAESATEALTVAPIPQVLQVEGNVVGGVVAVPVCGECRKKQLGVQSKTGLVTV